jgi:hypothetical protein
MSRRAAPRRTSIPGGGRELPAATTAARQTFPRPRPGIEAVELVPELHRNRPVSDPRDFDVDLRVVDFLKLSFELAHHRVAAAFVRRPREMLLNRAQQPRQNLVHRPDLRLVKELTGVVQQAHVNAAIPQPGNAKADSAA